MSLFDAAERFASIDRSQLVFDSVRCLHSQDQHSECAACFSVCPVQAITAGKPPVLNLELCQSCLACLPACPMGAYRADDDVANLLNCATHIDAQPVELICGLHTHPEAGVDSESLGIQVHGCLAGLGMGAYLTLSALGITRIISRTDACRDCKWQTLDPEIHKQTERANRFLSAWGRGETITCVDEVELPVARALWDAKNPPLSRRDLFRMMARQGQVAMARAMENGAAPSERKPGRDRLRLLSAVSHLPAPQAENSSHCLEGLNFATLTVSEACSACGACARVCPTEALRFEKNDEELTFSLSFFAQNCIGCGLCDHVCLPNAITINPTTAFEEVFKAKEPVITESGTLVRCERCRILMARREGVEYCPICEYRRTHPFGSMMPKKVFRKSLS